MEAATEGKTEGEELTVKNLILRPTRSKLSRLNVDLIASDGPHHVEKISTRWRKSLSASSPQIIFQASSVSITVAIGMSSCGFLDIDPVTDGADDQERGVARATTTLKHQET